MKVLNYHRLNGRIPDGAFYAGRPNPSKGLRDMGLGNPFKMRDQTSAERDRVCDAHLAQLRSRCAADETFAQWLLDTCDERDGVCFCAPKRCHVANIFIVLRELKARGMSTTPRA